MQHVRRLGATGWRGTRAAKSGEKKRRETFLCRGVGTSLLLASPHQTCAPAQLQPRGDAGPQGLSAPQHRSSLGEIRGDETSRKMQPHMFQGICHELVLGWPPGAAMSCGAGAAPGAPWVTGDTCSPMQRGQGPALASCTGDGGHGDLSPRGKGRLFPSCGQ